MKDSLGTTINNKITNKKDKGREIVALERLEGALVYSLSAQLGTEQQETQKVHSSLHVHR